MRGSVALMIVLVGCARGGGTPTDRNDTGSAGDAGTDVSGRDSGGCSPACLADETCMGGRCVPLGEDGDGDGVPVDVDCDDTNAAVGRVATRTCSSDCGSGIQQCTDGVFAECTAPTDCDCTDGSAPRTVGCGACGMQRQVCAGGTWANEGSCTDEGLCTPGATEMASCGRCGTNRRSCQADCTWSEWSCTGEGVCELGQIERESRACGGGGACGGTQERSRTCVAGCAWGDWSDYGTCSGSGGGDCSPGETERDTESCGGCGGMRARTRVCGDDCRWGTFGEFGACVGGTGSCTPGDTRDCSNGDSCGQEVCNASCSWSGCQPRTPTGCLRIRPGTSGPAGNNFRCCTPPGGGPGWQFCLSTCAWSTACEPNSCS